MAIKLLNPSQRPKRDDGAAPHEDGCSEDAATPQQGVSTRAVRAIRQLLREQPQHVEFTTFASHANAYAGFGPDTTKVSRFIGEQSSLLELAMGHRSAPEPVRLTDSRFHVPRNPVVTVLHDVAYEARRTRRCFEEHIASQSAGAERRAAGTNGPGLHGALEDEYCAVITQDGMSEIDRQQYLGLIADAELGLVLDLTTSDGTRKFPVWGPGIADRAQPVELSFREAWAVADLARANRPVRACNLPSLRGLNHPHKVIEKARRLIGDNERRGGRRCWTVRLDGKESRARFKFDAGERRFAVFIPLDNW